MLYRVTARFRTETAARLCQRLDAGSIAAQQPDGREIIASLERAVVTDAGNVRWTETCYCPTPLAHERSTVLDDHFTEIATEPIAQPESYDGQPFMEYLRGMGEG